MSTFRLAIVECTAATKCLELQKLVTNEDFEEEWIHYCIVKDAAQALEVVAEVEPAAVPEAEIDLANPVIHGTRREPLPDARRAKHLRGWQK